MGSKRRNNRGDGASSLRIDRRTSGRSIDRRLPGSQHPLSVHPNFARPHDPSFPASIAENHRLTGRTEQQLGSLRRRQEAPPALGDPGNRSGIAAPGPGLEPGSAFYSAAFGSQSSS